MDNIVFEEELVREVVYEGDFIIDERLTPNQQRRKIFNQMKKDNIPVMNESEYRIDYEGVEDNEGLSETQTTHYVVTRIYKKQIPYRTTKEKVYQGTYILDGLRITPEEQRRKIFDMMRDEGYSVEDESEYEISFEGVEDNEGLSETQTTKFVVSRIKKEKLTDAEYEALKQDPSNEARRLLEEMQSLKKEVLQTKDQQKVEELKEKVEDVTGKVDTMVEQTIKNYGYFEEQIHLVNKEIKDIEKLVEENLNAYEASYEAMKKIMEENAEDSERKKERENEKSLTIRKEIEKLKRQLSTLKSKKTTLQKDYDMARALGLSTEEYQELTSNLRKKEILNAILEKKGLSDIVAIPSRERTPQQKKTIMDAKKEVMEELAKMQRENERQSVLSSIEALYGIELQKVRKKGKDRVIIVKKESFQNMKESASKLPEKIIKKEENVIDYIPDEMPKDLEGVFASINDTELKGTFIPGEENIRDVILRDHGIDIDKDPNYEVRYEGVSDNNGISETQTTEYVVYKKDTKEERKDVKEKFTIFHDGENLYARKPVFERFHLDPQGEEVKIEGTASYGINKEDAEYVERNANNSYSPYVVEHKEAEVVREKPEEQEQKDVKVESNEEVKEPITSKGITDKITIFRELNHPGSFYVRKPVFERFHMEPIGEEVRIQGVASYKINPEDVGYIVKNAKNNYSPYIISYVDISLEDEKQNTPTIEDIMERVKPENKPKEVDHYTPENIQASDDFKKELKEGKVKYSIITKVSGRIKAAVSFFTKLGENLLKSTKKKSSKKEIEDTLESISDEELKNLLRDYKVLEENPSFKEMKPRIQWKLKDYGANTLKDLDKLLDKAYTGLSEELKELKDIEEESKKENQTDDDLQENEEKRVKTLHETSKIIQNIVEAENESKKLLNCGVEELEEFYKKFTKDFLYIGKNKEEELDEKLRMIYANYDNNLNTAIINHNDASIVQNFLGAKSCFSKDESIRGKIVGRRNIGSTYYPMVAKNREELDKMFEEDSKQEENIDSKEMVR